MNFTQFLLILRARWLVAVLALGLTVAVTLVVSLLLPKSYTATTTLVVDAKAKDSVTGALLPSQLLPAYLATQVDIIHSRAVAVQVVNGLRLDQVPALKSSFDESTGGKGDIRYWLADLLLDKLEVKPSRESSVIEIAFTGSDPVFAATVANAFAQAYIRTNLELKVQPARQTSAWYEGKIKDLRANLEQAQARLSAFQREHGLVASDERMDVETARLADLSSQLVIAQSQTYDSLSRKRQSGESLPDVMNSPVVQGLRSELARAEANLAQMAEKLGENHPLRQSAKVEVETLKAKLNAEIASARHGMSTNAQVAVQRENDLRSSLAAQKAKLLQAKAQRDELAVLVRDADNAQRMYDAALQRFDQTSLEGESNQTDIAILNPAIPPAEASGPKVLRNVLIAEMLGTLLGIGLAFLMEMIDRRVRSAGDLAEDLGIPVLAEMRRTPRQGWPRLFAAFARPAGAA